MYTQYGGHEARIAALKVDQIASCCKNNMKQCDEVQIQGLVSDFFLPARQDDMFMFMFMFS